MVLGSKNGAGQQGQGQFATANAPQVQEDKSGLSSSKAISRDGRCSFLAGGLLSRPMAREVDPWLTHACCLLYPIMHNYRFKRAYTQASHPS